MQNQSIYERKKENCFMKKILVFGITDNPGGVESVIMSYYRNIDRNKTQFDFLCNTEVVAGEKEILSLGGRIYRITARSVDINKYRKDLEFFFSEHAKEYCAIWVNVCSLANIDYLIEAKKWNIPRRIIHSHNSQNMDSKLRGILHQFNRLRISKYATDYWACSKEAADWFYDGQIRNKAIIIHNAIDIDKMKFNSEKGNYYRNYFNVNDKIVIGNVGRLHFQKNQSFVIDIFNELVKSNPNYHLMIVGQGIEEDNLKEQVKMLKLEKYVTFTGVQKDIQGLLSCFDLFLFPSRFEGLSIAGLEAQANGLPMVCSKFVNPVELKVNNNFYFVDLKCSASIWAENCKELLKIGRVDFNTVKSNFIGHGYEIHSEVNKFQKLIDEM